MKVYNNSWIHLTLGIVGILIILAAGTLTKVIGTTIGIILMVATVIASPLLFLMIKKIPKHDDDIHYHQSPTDRWKR